MATIKLSDLTDALMFTSSSYSAEAYVCRKTGTVHWSGDEGLHDFDDMELPDDLDDEQKYTPLPDKRDLDLGTQLVFDFAARHLPDSYDEVRAMFRRKGAYSRFRDLVDRQDKLDRWHEFRDAEEKRVLRLWCEENGLQVEDEVAD